MKPTSSLSCTQQPVQYPYPKSRESSLCVCVVPFYFFKAHFNIILSPSKWSPSFIFPHQHTACISLLPHTCHMLCPSHYSWFNHLNYIWRGVQTEHTCMNPATAAAPHLSLDMPAITPPSLMSAPPVSYVTPLPTRNKVLSTDPELGSYVKYTIRPRCRWTPAIKINTTGGT